MLHRAGHEVHIVDRAEPKSASRIAAGLITPVTGRRFAKAEDFDSSWAVAEEFYRHAESTLGRQLLETKPAARFFSDDQERDFFLNERVIALQDEVELIADSEGVTVGFRMLKAARLRVSDYMNSTRDYFADRGQYHQADVDVTNDIVVYEGGVRLLKPSIEGTRLFFCQGFQFQSNPWFPGIPDAPSRGEILKVRIPGRTDQQVIHKGYWLAPDGAGDSGLDQEEFIVGATYDRVNLAVTETDEGREELEQALQRITTEPATIIGQVAAIRAGTRQRRPVCQVHSKYPQLAILNGLGSKGSLLAPMAARQLIEIVSSNCTTITQAERKPRSVTRLAHSIVRRTIQPGDTVIDATAGNGHDTVFLARCTGPSGHVIAIDIQDAAIQSTRARLETEGLVPSQQCIEGWPGLEGASPKPRGFLRSAQSSPGHPIHQETIDRGPGGVQLLLADHGAELSRLAEENLTVKAMMFNLGYLPGGNKQQTTSAASTETSITAGLKMLVPGGVVTVVVYRGHPGGQQEAQAVRDLAGSLNSSTFSVDVIPGSADNDESPVLYVFRRR